jgi:hypothetical protein
MAATLARRLGATRVAVFDLIRNAIVLRLFLCIMYAAVADHECLLFCWLFFLFSHVISCPSSLIHPVIAAASYVNLGSFFFHVFGCSNLWLTSVVTVDIYI